MSDRVSKWTGVLLLGAGAVAVAGGILLAVYYVKKRRAAPSSSSSPLAPAPAPTLEGVLVHEVPAVVVLEETDSSALNMEEWSNSVGLQGTDGGNTYEDIYRDVKNCLRPLFGNNVLYNAFLEYIQEQTKATERFTSLSKFVQQCESSLSANRPLPESTSTDFNPIVNSLSADSALAEVQALSPLLNAILEYPSHIARRAVDLDQEKKQTLVELIRSTPYGVSKHVYMDEGPFKDADLQPFMTRMGFSIPPYQTKLTFTASDDGDRLSSGLYLLLGTGRSH